MRKELREVIDWARSHGCVFLGTQKSGHNALETPDGVLVTFSATPSDVHAPKRLKRDVCDALGINFEHVKVAGRFSHKRKRSRLVTHRSRAEQTASIAAVELEREIGVLDALLVNHINTGSHDGLMDRLVRRAEVAEALEAMFKPVPPHPCGDVADLVSEIREERVGQE